MKVRVVLDAMGGDFAPQEIIKGGVLAKKEYKKDLELLLVGDKPVIEEELKKRGADFKDFEIIHAPEIIEMADSPAKAVKRKKESSIVKGIELIKNNYADAFVSAGSTGAVVAGSVLNLGLLPGIMRPGIAILVPSLKGKTLIIDVGANIDPKPIHLLQYAVMGRAYYKLILGKDNVKIGILNIGEEETKGTEFLKETRLLLQKSDLNFIGNVEAKDIYSGKCEVVVCDGFAGNVALKVSEGFAEIMSKFLFENLRKGFLGKLGLLFIKEGLKNFKKIIDYSEYGGAPLLGVNGIVIISHGRSNAKAIKNAIKVAMTEVERNLNEKITQEIKNVRM